MITHLLTRAFLTLTLAALPLHVGFASSANGVDEELRLRERATGFWEAKIKRDDSLFDFYVSEEKGGPKPHQTPELGAVQFSSYEILGVTIEGDRATVTTRNEVEFASKRLRPLPEKHRKVTLSQRWLRFEGDWYKEPLTPGFGAFESFRANKRAWEAKQKAEADAAESQQAEPQKAEQ